MAKNAIILSLLALLQIQLLLCSGREITIVNNCSYTVWPASSTCSSINFSLPKGDSQSIDLPSKQWEQIWGRTLCDNSTGKFVCKTGDCASGEINCTGAGVVLDATLIEFTLDSYGFETDNYVVSLVIGYNLPVLVVPKARGCKATGCIFDIDGACPKELKRGGVCLNPCTVYETEQYCCPGVPDKCEPTNYTRIFKKACPRAYSYPYDNATAQFTCRGSPHYTITFCPSPSGFLKESSSLLPLLSPSSSPSPLLSPTNLASRRQSHSMRSSLLVVLPIAIFILLFSVTWIFIHKRRTTKRYNAEIDDIRSVESLQFDLNTIRTATHNFSAENKLGEGGFGEVYKGKLRSGQEVAIKRLSKTSIQGVVEFRTEVVLVAKLQHKNLVKLLGFCLASKEKILVYEYLPNSSLDKFLFDPTKKATLDWQTRLKIIVGIARGLLYLHEDSRLKVIHRDLKTSNILLDEDMNPKISDFGLAKLFGVDQTQGDTNRIVGTYGYMAPEYAITGHYSVKSDVFSFGVVILEIVSGQKNKLFGGVQLEEALLHHAWRLWNERKPLDLVDRSLNNNLSEEEVMKCIHIGLLCIQEDAIQRPRMTSIVASFSGQSINLPMPKPPNFFGSVNTNVEEHHALLEDASPHVYTGSNTITDLYSRE